MLDLDHGWESGSEGRPKFAITLRLDTAMHRAHNLLTDAEAQTVARGIFALAFVVDRAREGREKSCELLLGHADAVVNYFDHRFTVGYILDLGLLICLFNDLKLHVDGGTGLAELDRVRKEVKDHLLNALDVHEQGSILKGLVLLVKVYRDVVLLCLEGDYADDLEDQSGQQGVLRVHAKTFVVDQSAVKQVLGLLLKHLCGALDVNYLLKIRLWHHCREQVLCVHNDAL